MRDDHEHKLKLVYDCPVKGKFYKFYCVVCNEVVPWNNWTYFCKECDYGTHLDCVDREVCYKTSGDPVAYIRMNMQRLEEQMEISRINAIARANILGNIR